MSTEKQRKAIAKAQKRKAQIDEWRTKAEMFDRINKEFHSEGFSFNLRQTRLVALRNSWVEFFTTLKETCGLNENDSSLL